MSTRIETPRRRLRAIIIVAIAFVAIFAIGLWVWKAWLEDRLIPKRWGTIEEGVLYRSGQISSALIERQLVDHGIRCVVDLTARWPGDDDQKAEAAVIERLGIESVVLDLKGDGTGDLGQYIAALERMHRAEREKTPLLIHCAAGSQRTGGVVAFYRLLVQGKSPERVRDELEAYDWDPAEDTPLRDYINENIGEVARRLIECGIIERVPEPLPVLP
jgi:hypothetical protein